MKITKSSSGLITLTVGGVRAGIRVCTGPWAEGVNPDQIKLYPKKSSFPASFKQDLRVENYSDSREDYFDKDSIRLIPGHPLYAQAVEVAP